MDLDPLASGQPSTHLSRFSARKQSKGVFGHYAIREFIAHYHLERNHQGLDYRLLTPMKTVSAPAGVVRKRERVGGLLNYYYREAA